MGLPERLRELRKEMNLTQEELANKLNLTKANISKYETGRIEPNIETINFLAKFFNVSVDYLLGRTDVRSPHSDSENELTEEEKELLEKIKSDPELSILFHDLKSAPKKKIKQLLKTWEFVQEQFEEWDDEEE
jgi:transcriptional regulator with XRE-family HTH domain